MGEDQQGTATGGAPHDGPDRGNSSQGEPGSAADEGGAGEKVAEPVPDPGAPSDSNEGADARVVVVEPGGEDVSPRA